MNPQQHSEFSFSPSQKKTKLSHHNEQDIHEEILSPEIRNMKTQPILAADTLVWIGTYLDIIDVLKSMSGVCKYWNQVCAGDVLWRMIFQRELGPMDWFLQKLNQNLRNANSGSSFKICPMKSYRTLFDQNEDHSQSTKISYKIITEEHEHFETYECRPGYATDSDQEDRVKTSTMRRKNLKFLDEKQQQLTEQPENNRQKKKLLVAESPELSMDMIQQVLQDCFGEDRIWLNLFKLVVSLIPIQNYKMMTEKQIIQPLQNIVPLNSSKNNAMDDEEDYTDEEEAEEDSEDSDESKTAESTNPEEFFQKDFVFKGRHDEESWHNLMSKNYCYFTVRLDEMVKRIESSKVEHASLLRKALYFDIKTHKLAVILSIFDRHGLILRYFGSPNGDDSTKNYLNTISDQLAVHVQNVFNYDLYAKKNPALPRTPYIAECAQMCVGVKTSYHLISVLKFCFSVLCEKEDLIYQPSLALQEINKDQPAKTIWYDDRLVNSKLPLEKSIAVGPLTQDAFMPFCKYLLMDRPVFDRYSYGVSRVSAKMDGKQQKAHFACGKPGWCCGFWNANFYWYNAAKFSTEISKCDDGHAILKVEQDQSNILHNLC
ncbi:hypothetical protein C9374_014335 [Naegleria lovaniensis]|uniref:F-box domain-containing protein n=1 Tax=Naegleria lovaniensis TaxID=51637 RepID=A0AA88GXP1_NAELO|nr:uncharacterized protein C9374_014335 [Naegleria lovaniensis]KAG2388935.1 hypothetical protein C9374_014335 [Naegleria lovaniensis]